MVTLGRAGQTLAGGAPVRRCSRSILRAFLAARLPLEIHQALDENIARLKSKLPEGAVRWVRAENIHLTLKFLGEITPNQVDKLVEAAAQYLRPLSPFELRAIGLGVFPQPAKPRVIWVGVKGDGARLNSLQGGLESRLAREGFEADERGYHPHLTLGRTRRDLRRDDEKALADALAAEFVGDLGVWRVRRCGPDAKRSQTRRSSLQRGRNLSPGRGHERLNPRCEAACKT